MERVVHISGNGSGNCYPSLRYADHCRTSGYASCHDGWYGLLAGSIAEVWYLLHLSSTHQCLRQT